MPIPGIIFSSRRSASTAFESIASASGTGSSGTITFSSIPSTYQHLQIRYLARGDGATNGFAAIGIQFNGVTSTNYVKHGLKGTGSAVSAYATTAQTSSELEDALLLGGTTASCFSVGIIDIHNYSVAGQYKTIRSIYGSDSNSTVGTIGLHSGSLYSTTNAITSVSLISSTGNFTSTSTFALYGIKGA